MKRANGFTLIELMITMAVAVVLMTVGIPAFKSFVKNNRVIAETGKVIIAMQVVRSEAVKRGSGAVICASTDQATCSTDTNWATGWITFSDLDQDATLDGDGSCTTEADQLSKECILRINNALEDVTLTSGADNVQFLPSGLATNAPVVFTAKAVDCTHRQQRAITVSRQGHVSSAEQDCS